ncbi:unnamed protein product [Mytilus edulis]|uniref:Uncharacterized protein n=1 Tax=Mytilus edulis TaxID=6550 RepID=A0A8S3Q5Q7_MYTED|nr:unnamed protein product [Mytilus edulis]
MMEVGEFVLYRNDNGPYWVHALFTNCGWIGASYNCGIAVSRRSSLFVIRTCAVNVKNETRTIEDTNYQIDKLLTSAMENEQLFVQEPGFINDELNVNLKNTPTNISTATTFCSWGCKCSNGYIGDYCSTDVSTPPVNISLPAEGLCTTNTRASRKTNIYGDFLSTEIWYKIRYSKVVDNSQSYSSNWEVNKAEYRNMFMVTVELSVARKTRAASGLHMAEGYDITLSNDGVNFGDEVTILIYDDGYSNTTIIALASSVGVIGVVVCVLALLFYLKHKNSDGKTKVGIYSGCQHESGKYVDNDMLSDRTKTFREYSISDLDLNIEDGGDASVGNFEKQHPPQTHFKSNL